MATKKLTLKQQRFITEYLKTGNATESAHKAGYSDSSRNTLAQQAFENLKNPNILDAINRELVKAEITPEWIMFEFKKVAGNDNSLNYPSKLKALENLSKIIELTGFKQQNQSTTNIQGDVVISFGKPEPKQLTPSNVIDV